VFIKLRDDEEKNLTELASAKSNGKSTSLAFEYNSIKAELRSFSLSSSVLIQKKNNYKTTHLTDNKLEIHLYYPASFQVRFDYILSFPL